MTHHVLTAPDDHIAFLHTREHAIMPTDYPGIEPGDTITFVGDNESISATIRDTGPVEHREPLLPPLDEIMPDGTRRSIPVVVKHYSTRSFYFDTHLLAGPFIWEAGMMLLDLEMMK